MASFYKNMHFDFQDGPVYCSTQIWMVLIFMVLKWICKFWANNFPASFLFKSHCKIQEIFEAHKLFKYDDIL